MILRTVYKGKNTPTSAVLDIDEAFAKLLCYDLSSHIMRGTSDNKLILRKGDQTVIYASENKGEIFPLIAAAGRAARVEGKHAVADECNWMLGNSGYQVPRIGYYVPVEGLSTFMCIAISVTHTLRHCRALKLMVDAKGEETTIKALGALLVDNSPLWRAEVIQDIKATSMR